MACLLMCSRDKGGDFITSITLELPDVAEESSSQVGVSHLQARVVIQEINLHNDGAILQYGEVTQLRFRSLASVAFSRIAEGSSKLVAELLDNLNSTISDFCVTTQHGERSPFSFFKKRRYSQNLRLKYETTCKTVEGIEKELLNQRNTLLVDIELLTQLHARILECLQELTAHIAAGEETLRAAQTGELVELQQRAESNQAQEDILLYNNFVNNCNAFEERLADLKTTKTICAQTIAQILLVRNANQRLVQSIQNSLENTLAAWTQSVAIALALEHSDNTNRAVDISAIQIHNAELQDAIRQALSAQTMETNTRLEVKTTLQTLQDTLDNSNDTKS